MCPNTDSHLRKASQDAPANCVASRSDSTASSTTLSPQTAANPSSPEVIAPRAKNLFNNLLFRQDHRARLSPHVSRFLGHRPPTSAAHYDSFPFPPFTWLRSLPLRYETWLFAFVGAFTSILLIEAVMTTSTAFRDIFHSPIIVASFGASAVLVFGVTESPLAQPRNAVLGQFVSALVATAITRLWLISNPHYIEHLDNKEFYAPSFVNGALCMAVALLVQLMLGVVHPPGGATALAAATDPTIVAISWNYVPVILASSLIMLGWSILFNNLGRRRYPVYWWAPGQTFMREVEQEFKDLETGQQHGGTEKAVEQEALAEALAMSRP